MMHSTNKRSSIISSSIAATLPLPKSNSHINNVMPFEMTAKYSDASTKYNNRHHYGHSNGVISEEWSKKANTAISPYASKSCSLSSSSSTSSGCISDIELANSPDHSHHDTSPDSPDSGVSGSLHSPDDLKHVDDEENDSIICTNIHQSNETSLQITNFDVFSSDLTSVQIINSSKVTQIEKEFGYLKVDTKLDASIETKSSIKLYCKWRDCDWPGNYDELAEHVREIHVELQPFLDPISGKLIKWYSHKSAERPSNEEDDEDCISNVSDNEEHDEEEDYDEDDPDDDTQSVSSSITGRVTRRSNNNKVQNSLDSSQNSSRSYKLRQSSRLTDQRVCSEKPSENQFVCLWKGCKVYGKPSSSKQWLERHVRDLHSGPKPYKCIVDRCGQRFKKQESLLRHVNTHFKGANLTSLSTLLNSTVPQTTNNKNVDNEHIKVNCCCRCACHNCLICDNSTYDISATHSEKNRCYSTDSAISFTSLDLSLSFSTSKSLSKPHSSNVTSEHCHVNCCMSASKPKCDNLASLLLQKSKLSKNNKKNISTSSKPNVKGWSQFDFYDQYSANLVKHHIRAEESSVLKVNRSVRKVGHILKGKFIPSYDDSDLSENELYPSDLDEEGFPIEIPRKSKRKVVGVFERKLFQNNQVEGFFKFHSEVIGSCCSNGEETLRLRWHPLGILSNTWIKKDDIECNRFKSVPFSELPKQFQLFLKEKRSQAKCPKPLSKKRKTEN